MTDEEVAAHNDEMLRIYQLTFGPPWGQKVLLDLMKQCHFRVPLDSSDPNALLVAEGERRVFCYILGFFNMTLPKVNKLFAGQPIPTGENNGQ
jgi:hypothetical protein